MKRLHGRKFCVARKGLLSLSVLISLLNSFKKFPTTLITAHQRSCGKSPPVPAPLLPGHGILGPHPPSLSRSLLDIGPQGPPVSDIWWPSLEALITSGLPPKLRLTSGGCCSKCGQCSRAVRILLECFLV